MCVLAAGAGQSHLPFFYCNQFLTLEFSLSIFFTPVSLTQYYHGVPIALFATFSASWCV